MGVSDECDDGVDSRIAVARSAKMDCTVDNSVSAEGSRRVACARFVYAEA